MLLELPSPQCRSLPELYKPNALTRRAGEGLKIAGAGVDKPAQRTSGVVLAMLARPLDVSNAGRQGGIAMNSILHHRQPRPPRVSGKPQRPASRTAKWLKRIAGGLLVSSATAAGVAAIAWRCSEAKYEAPAAMRVPLAAASIDADYDDRRLLLIQRDATHYDFVLEPTSERVARVVLKNVDVSSLAPQVNATGYGVGEAQRLTFAASDAAVEIRGGDGFEAQQLTEITIASQQGHAMGWNISLAADAGGASATYYRGEFQFPLGHYRELFEFATGLNYADYRRELEAEAPLVASGDGSSAWR